MPVAGAPKSCPTPPTISSSCEICSFTMLVCSCSVHFSKPSSLPMTILMANLPRILPALVTSIAAGLSLVNRALSPLKRAGISVGFLIAAPAWQPVYDGIAHRGGNIVRRQINAVPYVALHRGAVIGMVRGQRVNIFWRVRPPPDLQDIKGTARGILRGGRQT